jgi:hypothetical protein
VSLSDGGPPTLPSTSAGEALPPLSSSEALPPPVSSSEVLPPPVSSSEVLPPPVSSSEALPPPVSSSEVLPPPVSSSEALPPPVSSSEVLPPPVSSSEALPLPASSSEVLPPPASSGDVLPPLSPGEILPPPASSGPSGNVGPSPPSPSSSPVPSPSGIFTIPGGTVPAPIGSIIVPIPTGSGIIPVPTGSGIVPAPTGSGIIPVPTGSGIVPAPTGSGIIPVPTGSGIIPVPTDSIIVPVPTGSGPGASGIPSPSSSGAPAATTMPLVPGQPFTINIAPFLRNLGDQALSWVPSPVWLLYNSNVTSFYGTIPPSYPPGQLDITVTAGQPTTGSNAPQRRQTLGVYTFDIELAIVGPSGPPLPTPSLPTSPVGPSTSAVLPSYTNTIYQTIMSTITRCPVCKPEITLFAVPIGTTCITAEVFTTPCPVTYTKTLPNGAVRPMVTTTISKIPYNPDESTIYVKTVDYLTTKYTTTLLVAITRTIQRVVPTSAAGPVQPPPPSPPGPPGGAAAPVPGPPAPPPGPVAPPRNGAIGTGAYKGSQGAKPTVPVTAGASMDRFVEMFVLLSAIALGALLML